YGEDLALFRSIQFRLGEANTLLALGRLCAFQHRTEEGEQNLQAARSFFIAIEERVGQTKCCQSFSDLYRTSNRAPEALREALAGLLLALSADLDPTDDLVRVALLKKKIGPEALDALALEVVSSFPAEDQEILHGAMKGLGEEEV